MASLLFDLDGTLTDPAVGITACIQYALRQLGHPEPACDALLRFIGPPLHDSFAELLQTEDPSTLAAALGHYRGRFSTLGLFENTVYPCIPAGLAALQAAGHRMWVATSKPTLYAQRIVEHFALASYFVRVHGSELSGVRADKTELVKHVLMVEDLDPTTTWMIGDRPHDVRGGRANGIRTAGVLWGYGSARELTDAGAEIVVDTMDTLIWHLGARIQ